MMECNSHRRDKDHIGPICKWKETTIKNIEQDRSHTQEFDKIMCNIRLKHKMWAKW